MTKQVGSPRVSVGMPVWNGENYLERAIRSVLAQDFEDFELIVSDNGSTDGTQEICRRFAAEDPRVRYHRFDENQGAARNYNVVFELARGEFFKWAAHDDECRPEFLRRCLECFASSPESVVLVYPRAVFIDAEGRETGMDNDHMETGRGRPWSRLAAVLRRLNLASPIFGLIRSDALRRTRLIGNFESSDYVLFAELAMLGEFVEVPDRLFLRRIHPAASREANRTRESVAAWFDPKTRPPRWLSERQLLVKEYLRSVSHADLSLLDRWLCYAAVPSAVLEKRMRVFGGRWKRKLLGRNGNR